MRYPQAGVTRHRSVPEKAACPSRGLGRAWVSHLKRNKSSTAGTGPGHDERRGGAARYMPGIFVTSTTSIVAPFISRCGWPTNIFAAASWEAASTIV